MKRRQHTVTSSLRRHYPDQVCGYYLSDLPGQMHPGKKINLQRKDNKNLLFSTKDLSEKEIRKKC